MTWWYERELNLFIFTKAGFIAPVSIELCRWSFYVRVWGGGGLLSPWLLSYLFLSGIVLILRSQSKKRYEIWAGDQEKESVWERLPQARQHRVSQQHAEHLVCPRAARPDSLRFLLHGGQLVTECSASCTETELIWVWGSPAPWNSCSHWKQTDLLSYRRPRDEGEVSQCMLTQLSISTSVEITGKNATLRESCGPACSSGQVWGCQVNINDISSTHDYV